MPLAAGQEIPAPEVPQAPQAEQDAGVQGPAAAPPPALPGFEVVEIRIDGNRRIDTDAIRSAMATRVGSRLSATSVAEDIRRIMELGFFGDVNIDASEMAGGTLLTVHVLEHPIIRRVTITGNENLKSEEITEQLTLTIGSTIDYPLVLENQLRIEAMYQTKGYFLAEVGYTVEPVGSDAVSIDYEVEEGKELRLTKVEFTGNEMLDDGELLRGLETKPWGWLSYISHFWDHSGLYAEPIFYQDLDTISRKYADRGFIRAQIGDPEVEIDEEGIEVHVAIEEGPQYHVGSVDVLGDETLDRDELMASIALGPERIFSRTMLSDDVERLRLRYSNRGFYAARVRPRTDVDPDQLTVDVLFEVEKNDLFFVDWIRVAGNTRTRDEVVRREISLAEGELYSDGALQRSRARVRRLGFFEEVEVEAQQIDERNVGVTIDVVERPTGSFSFDAGVGSTDGFLLNASIRQDNLFGRGYAVNASVDLGTNNSYAALRFSDPYFLGSVAGFGASLTLTDREFLDFDQDVFGIGFDVSYPLDEGETRAGTAYGFSSREVTGFGASTAASMLQREEFQEDTTTSLMSLSIRRDTRDDIRFPKHGHVLGGAFEFAGLGGLSEFVRIEGRATWYLPVRRWLGFESTFVANSRFGWVVPMNDIDDFDLPTCATTALPDAISGCDLIGLNTEELSKIDDDLELPLTERYFLGGVGPFQLRGFEQRSVGPRRTILTPPNQDFRSFVFTAASETGFPCDPLVETCNDITEDDAEDFHDVDLTDVIGGNKMFLLNLELQFPISEDLGLVGIVFFDMGNAFGENEAFNPADFRFSTGVGAQWFSPFGPVLVTFGVPLDPLDDEKGSVFEFSLGGQQF